VCGSLGTIAGATSLSHSHSAHSVEEGLVVEVYAPYDSGTLLHIAVLRAVSCFPFYFLLLQCHYVYLTALQFYFEPLYCKFYCSSASLPSSPSLIPQGGLQYFENLRMARIFNATFHDPDSIQIDIDDLIQNYSSAMRRILRHVGITSSQPNYYEILGVRILQCRCHIAAC
jgi:hypothetical protein